MFNSFNCYPVVLWCITSLLLSEYNVLLYKLIVFGSIWMACTGGWLERTMLFSYEMQFERICYFIILFWKSYCSQWDVFPPVILIDRIVFFVPRYASKNIKWAMLVLHALLYQSDRWLLCILWTFLKFLSVNWQFPCNAFVWANINYYGWKIYLIKHANFFIQPKCPLSVRS